MIITPTGGESGRRNADITTDLNLWNRQTQLGYTFDSSTCFKFPNGAERSPDASWIERSRWEALSSADREKFPPIAPDFVIELWSATDRLATLQAKMDEYRENGVRLGWLIDPQNKTVEIYRPGQAVEILQAPQQIDGGDVLSGFGLDVENIL